MKKDLLISAVVRKARKFYKCDDCHKTIRPNEPYMRLYGRAHSEEKPWEIKSHLNHVRDSTSPKVIQALLEWATRKPCPEGVKQDPSGRGG